MSDPVPVVWYPIGDAPARGYWDQGVLEDLFAGRLWQVPSGRSFVSFTHGDPDCPPDDVGAVMVIPARYAADEVTSRLVARWADAREWSLVVLAGDEESTFPTDVLPDGPGRLFWQMTPRPDRRTRAHRYMGEGYPPHIPALLASQGPLDRHVDVSFAGQVTHERRREAVEAVGKLGDRVVTEVLETESFTAGLAHDDYAAMLGRSKIVVCPSGPATPSTFRAWEALEAGCVPIVDDRCPAFSRSGYWSLVADGAPFPAVRSWDRLGDVVDMVLDDWPMPAVRASAWWQAAKRDLAYDLSETVDYLSKVRTMPTSVADLLTVVVTTSPIRSHPDTAIIEETIESVLAQSQLAGCEVIIAADGVRPEQDHLAGAYAEYLQRVAWLCEHRWPNTLPAIADEHLHQARLTRHTLATVTTPLVLFLEHDTPIVGDVPWFEACKVVRSGKLNVLRLYHEGVMPAEHRHLMLDDVPQSIEFVPVIRTQQWSQRPHIASTAFYRRILRDYFGPEARTMIEDVMHGVVDYAVNTEGAAGWDRFRVGIYAPAGDMRRSGHLDGRQGDEKFGMWFAYDGPTPAGAPRATAERAPEER